MNSCHEILAQPFVAAATPSDSIRRCNEPFSGSWLRSRDLLTQLDCNFLVKKVEFCCLEKNRTARGTRWATGERKPASGTHTARTQLSKEEGKVQFILNDWTVVKFIHRCHAVGGGGWNSGGNVTNFPFFFSSSSSFCSRMLRTCYQSHRWLVRLFCSPWNGRLPCFFFLIKIFKTWTDWDVVAGH